MEDVFWPHMQKRGSGEQVTPYFAYAARRLTVIRKIQWDGAPEGCAFPLFFVSALIIL